MCCCYPSLQGPSCLSTLRIEEKIKILEVNPMSEDIANCYPIYIYNLFYFFFFLGGGGVGVGGTIAIAFRGNCHAFLFVNSNSCRWHIYLGIYLNVSCFGMPDS